ncbi:MraY family glycosyltransferase [Cereibacter sphaeroides]|uniref:MraY family glycosyltransferase n=1 Tax=Cereibacter sphaeroides TaxID=1063 RepID=UPI001F255495|nr:glycosyltransferase [Cereibacter sphaeroides]MCE6967121.1 glycosyltransferase [Cereibacter sphaeroides]
MAAEDWIPILAAFSASASTAFLIVLTRDHHISLVLRRDDLRATQAAHSVPTPRIGGIALLAGLAAATLLGASHVTWWQLLLLSVLPVALAGLLEDLGLRLKPAWRLAAAVLSSLIVVATLGTWLPRLDVPGLDLLIAWSPLAIAFTVFAVAGVCNAFNLIDGMNGLAGSTGVITALGLTALAFHAGQPDILHIALLAAAATTGFLIFNFPQGRLFLGDAGAYTLGHLLAWIGILLLIRAETLTPWAVLLVFYWPVADTLLAIWRRRRAGRRSDEPDRLHFHQLVMRALEILVFGRGARHLANPLTTLLLIPMIAAPVLTGVLLWNQPLAAFTALAAFAALFVATYLAGMTLAARRGPIQAGIRKAAARTLRPEPGIAPLPNLGDRA